jgi:hypothetical protein
MAKKKVNPRRRPATQADVERAKSEAVCKAIVLAKVLTFTALLDLGFLKTPEEVRMAWDKTKYLADSNIKGYCSIQDMYNALIEDYGVDLEG